MSTRKRTLADRSAHRDYNDVPRTAAEGFESGSWSAGATPRLSALILGPARGLTPSTRRGSAYAAACRRLVFAYAVIAASGRTHRAPVARGWSPP